MTIPNRRRNAAPMTVVAMRTMSEDRDATADATELVVDVTADTAVDTGAVMAAGAGAGTGTVGFD